MTTSKTVLVVAVAAPLLVSCSATRATVESSTPEREVAIPPMIVDGWAACLARDRDRVASGDTAFASIMPIPPSHYPSFSTVHIERDGTSVEYSSRIDQLTFTCWYQSDSGTAQVGWNQE